MNNSYEEDDTLYETESYIVWKSEEDEGMLYHVELGGVTLHLTSEEWEELVLLVKGADAS
jgi:hypothetical protein